MADDRLTAALEEIRERRDRRLTIPVTSLAAMQGAIESAGDVPRLLAALDAVLEHHQPRQLYGMVEDFRGNPLCGHDPDKDWDQHFEADDGIWYCKDKPTVKVCISCTDGPDGDLWAEWPCPTYEDITRELLGEAGDG